MAKVMLGMSGGVDSSAAAVLLQKAGHEVAGVTMLLSGDDGSSDIADAKRVCEALNIKHFVLDIRDKFKADIIDGFCEAYAKGLTPNPCIVCNKKIKFGAMLDFALDNGCDFVATGHYARISEENGRFFIKKAADRAKDQSYVLYTLNQTQLSRILLPLGDIDKKTARSLAEENGLITAHKSDSQDICFVPDGDYASIIEKTLGHSFEIGDYVNLHGEILGRHKGIIHYTVGQRKGLGIALGKPMFVIGKDAKTNTVTLGDNEDLFSKNVYAADVNFLSGERPDKPIEISAKIRYNHKEQPATLMPHGDGYMIVFDEPQRAATPGQSVVFYDGDTLLGGGIEMPL